MTDVMDDVRAAMTELDAGAPPAPEPEPIVEAQEPTPGIDDAPAEAEKPADGPKRAADGKFLAKDPEVVQDTTEQPTEIAEPTQKSEAIRVPASWSPQAKAEFAKLSPEVQKAVSKRESEIEYGLQSKAKELKRYEPLEEVIAPHRQKWTVAGVDEATAIKQLLAASDWLERDPASAIAYLAKQYGAQIPAQPHQGQPQAQPAQDSQSELRQELQALRDQVQQAQQAPLLSEVQAFFSDDANLYAENVRDDMAVLLNAGRAQTLKEAYDKACWMRDDIRPLLQTQAKPQVDQDRVRKAQAAGSSVTGAPSSAPAFKSSGTVEDDIKLAMSQLAGQA